MRTKVRHRSFDQWQTAEAREPITEHITHFAMNNAEVVCSGCQTHFLTATKKGLTPLHRVKGVECVGSLRPPSFLSLW